MITINELADMVAAIAGRDSRRRRHVDGPAGRARAATPTTPACARCSAGSRECRSRTACGGPTPGSRSRFRLNSSQRTGTSRTSPPRERHAVNTALRPVALAIRNANFLQDRIFELVSDGPVDQAPYTPWRLVRDLAREHGYLVVTADRIPALGVDPRSVVVLAYDWPPARRRWSPRARGRASSPAWSHPSSPGSSTTTSRN